MEWNTVERAIKTEADTRTDKVKYGNITVTVKAEQETPNAGTCNSPHDGGCPTFSPETGETSDRRIIALKHQFHTFLLTYQLSPCIRKGASALSEKAVSFIGPPRKIYGGPTAHLGSGTCLFLVFPTSLSVAFKSLWIGQRAATAGWLPKWREQIGG